ncbi:MAG TPA: hypothetical protein DCZ20_11260 [Lachnospiraceae bacterium]|nr:hypothetical protein [Lachnospiraceae bacterium]
MRKSRKMITVLMSAALLCSMTATQAVSGMNVVAAAEEAVEKPAARAVSDIPEIDLTFGENQETPQYQAGAADQTLTINVRNMGKTAAKNITVKVQLDKSEWPFETSQMDYTQRIESLAAAGDADGKDAAVLELKHLNVPADVQTKSHMIRLQVTYQDETNQYRTNKNIYVKTIAAPEPEPEPTPEPTPDPGTDIGGDIGGGFVNGDVSGGSGSASVPRVIVTGFDTEPAVVKAGSDFKLIIHLQNTSKTTAVQNLLFDLEAPTEGSDAATASPAFLPASGSNSIYLDKIAKNGTQDISIVLNAKSDLVQKPYSINIGMKYENSEAAQFDSTASVSIPVKQDARFEFSEFEISQDTIEVGNEANVMCNLYNLGRTKLYNVKVNFEGEGISAQEQFLGNIESGATANIDAMLTGEAETTGDGTVKMIMSYEDEEGAVTTSEKTLTIFVTEPVIEDMGMIQEMEPEQKSFPILPCIIGVVVVIAIVATVVIIRKRKKRRLEQEEADLADEFDRFTKDE